MGNHKMEHCHIRINTISPKVLEVAAAEIMRQLTRIEVT